CGSAGFRPPLDAPVSRLPGDLRCWAARLSRTRRRTRFDRDGGWWSGRRTQWQEWSARIGRVVAAVGIWAPCRIRGWERRRAAAPRSGHALDCRRQSGAEQRGFAESDGGASRQPAPDVRNVFEYFRTQRKIFNLEYRVNYIIRLPISEMHVLARSDITSIEDLRGKRVNFGPAGSASSLTGTIVFQRLGVQVEQVLYDNPTALHKLNTGEIAALVRVIGKRIDFFAKIPANSGLRFVPIPFSKTFADYYTVGELTNKEYPTLIPEAQSVDTIGVPAVLAVF